MKGIIMIQEQEDKFEGATRISSKDVRDKLSEVLNKVAYSKEVFIVQRHSKDEVAVVPCELLANTIVLTDNDRDIFLSAFENPPPANAALKRAMARYHKHHS